CATLWWLRGPAPRSRAIGSAGERLVHTEEVTGSIPVSPTRYKPRSETPRQALSHLWGRGLQAVWEEFGRSTSPCLPVVVQVVRCRTVPLAAPVSAWRRR